MVQLECTEFSIFQFYIGDTKEDVEKFGVGSFLIAKEDVAKYRWRKDLKVDDVQPPPTDDEIWPEAWRIAKKNNSKAKPQRFKTVCRVIDIAHVVPVDLKKRVVMQPVLPGDLEITVQIFVRPNDIGRRHNCPYELYETDQGDFPTNICSKCCVCSWCN